MARGVEPGRRDPGPSGSDRARSLPRPGRAPDADDDAGFHEALARVMKLEPSEIERARALFRARELRRGAYLLRAGETASEVAVVVRGLLREHFVMQGGVERTKAFVVESDFTGSLSDLLSGTRSRAFIVAEEPARLLVAPYQALRRLAERDPAWHHFCELSMQRLFLRKAEREYELLGLDAEARYACFTRRYPELEARIAARHVASYLGITPVHLSRLRTRRRTQRSGSA
jgi:CRP-like cAMP-binding protein